MYTKGKGLMQGLRFCVPGLKNDLKKSYNLCCKDCMELVMGGSIQWYRSIDMNTALFGTRSHAQVSILIFIIHSITQQGRVPFPTLLLCVHGQ